MYKGKKCAQEQIIQMTDCEAMTVMRAKNNTQVDSHAFPRKIKRHLLRIVKWLSWATSHIQENHTKQQLKTHFS